MIHAMQGSTPLEIDDPTVPDSVRRVLAALPEFEPPPRLRPPGVLRSGRRAHRGIVGALAAGFAALALMLAWGLGERPTDLATADALDRSLGALRPERPSREALRLEWELAALEARLQAANDAGASADAALWREREAIRQELLAAYRERDLIRL
jgi:hypothetical protein